MATLLASGSLPPGSVVTLPPVPNVGSRPAGAACPSAARKANRASRTRQRIGDVLLTRRHTSPFHVTSVAFMAKGFVFIGLNGLAEDAATPFDQSRVHGEYREEKKRKTGTAVFYYR